MSPEPSDAEMSLVLPFVVCHSNGGPYDDISFTAGWWCGYIDTALDAAPAECQRLVFPVGIPDTLGPQLDLIAMHRGFTLAKTAPDDDEAFLFATFDRIIDYGEETQP